MRVLAGFTLLIVIAFSVVGFLGSFELGADPQHLLKGMYAIGGLGSGLFGSLTRIIAAV